MPFDALDCADLHGIELWSFVNDTGEAIDSVLGMARFLLAPGRARLVGLLTVGGRQHIGVDHRVEVVAADDLKRAVRQHDGPVPAGHRPRPRSRARGRSLQRSRGG